MTSLADTNLYAPQGSSVYGTWLSVDVVAFTEDLPAAKVVLIERHNPPHRGEITLPGGLLAAWNSETVDDAARRILQEKAGLTAKNGVVVTDVVSDPSRDERGHTVSIVVATRVPANSTGAVEVVEVPTNMPFGHSKMIARTREVISQRLLVEPDTTYAMLGDEITVAGMYALLRVCEDVSDTAARARLDRCGMFIRTRQREGVPAGRPPYIYRRRTGTR